MNFASDNWLGVHPDIMQAMADANVGAEPAYGGDRYTQQSVAELSRVFETDLQAFLVTTGTAANSLSLAALTPPYGAVLCHADAHINVDECGAPEFFTGGAKLIGLDLPAGKLTAAAVEAKLAQFVRGEHDPHPAAISLTQATELGTIYSIEEIRALAEVAHAAGMGVHMDGARFANALVTLDCSPAAMTWEAGVDILSFGGTKNGAMVLEAVVIFDPERAEGFPRRRMKGAQLLSKGRYLGAQLSAYLQDGLWLQTAGHANSMAARLAEGLSAIDGIRVPLPTQANEVFAVMTRQRFDALEGAGAIFYEWPGNGPGVDTIGSDEVLARFVCAFTTTAAQVDSLLTTAQSLGD